MQRRKSILLFAVTAALVALLIYGLRPRPVLVEGVTVARGPLTESFTEEGKTRVIDRYLVSAPVAGFARRIDLEVGDKVEARRCCCDSSLFAQTCSTAAAAPKPKRVSATANLEPAKERTRAATPTRRTGKSELARIQGGESRGSRPR
ncbi:MAG: hypothetical protein R2748_00505 [Bryobacterales bacterium]